MEAQESALQRGQAVDPTPRATPRSHRRRHSQPGHGRHHPPRLGDLLRDTAVSQGLICLKVNINTSTYV